MCVSEDRINYRILIAGIIASAIMFGVCMQPTVELPQIAYNKSVEYDAYIISLIPSLLPCPLLISILKDPRYCCSTFDQQVEKIRIRNDPVCREQIHYTIMDSILDCTIYRQPLTLPTEWIGWLFGAIFGFSGVVLCIAGIYMTYYKIPCCRSCKEARAMERQKAMSDAQVPLLQV